MCGRVEVSLGVTVNAELISARTIISAAANTAAPIGKSLGAGTDRAGRVLVNKDLSVPGYPEILAIGARKNDVECQ